MVALLGMVPSAGRLRTRATSTRSNVVPAWKGMAAVPIDTVTVCPDVVVVIGRGCDWNCWTTLGAITWTNWRLGSRTSVTVPVTHASVRPPHVTLIL